MNDNNQITINQQTNKNTPISVRRSHIYQENDDIESDRGKGQTKGQTNNNKY